MRRLGLLLALLPALVLAQAGRPLRGGSVMASTSAPLDLYVSTTGSDSNDCSVGSPCLTTQAAIDKIPYLIRHKVVLHMGAGSFRGARVHPHVFDSADPVVSGASITVQCALQKVTPATGSADFMVSSSTFASASAHATVTSVAGGWTSSDSVLKGAMACPNNGAAAGQPCSIIQGNTASVLQLVGDWFAGFYSPGAGDSFSVLKWATFFSDAVHQDTGAVTTSSGSYYSWILTPGFVPGLDQFRFNQCGWTMANGGYYPISMVAPGTAVRLDNVSLTGPNMYVGIAAVSMASITLNNSLVTMTQSSGTAINVKGYGFPGQSTSGPISLDMENTWFLGSGAGKGIAVQGDEVQIFSYGNRFESLARAFFIGNAHLESYYDFFTTMSVLGVSQSLGSTPNTFSALYFSGDRFTNCGQAAIRLLGGTGNFDCSQASTGSGADIGIKLEEGGNVTICPNTAITGATADLSLDGVTQSYATFRALSPTVSVGTKYPTTRFTQ